MKRIRRAPLGLGVAALAVVLLAASCVVKGTWTERPLAESWTVTKALDVSCVAADECMALVKDVPTFFGGAIALQRWDGTSWTEVDRSGEPETRYFAEDAGIECWAPDACMVRAMRSYYPDDTVDTYYTTLRWDGVALSEAYANSEYTPFLRCTSAGRCLAYSEGGTGALFVFDGTEWVEDQGTVPWQWDFMAGALACAAPLHCVKVPYSPAGGTDARHVDVETGGMQTVPFPVAIAARDVDCVSATSCVAVGTNGAASWDGTSWTTKPMVPTGVAMSVDCAKASECVAVGVRDLGGGQSEVVTRVWFGGNEWTDNATAVPAAVHASLRSIRQISCAPAKPLCMIVGNDAAGEGVAVSYTWG